MRFCPPIAPHPGAGRTLVAGEGLVIEIITARPLEQIAPRRRLVAQLPRSARQQRLGQQRITLPHDPVRGEIGVADLRADPEPAVALLDRVEAEPRDIDQHRRRLDLQLHQVEQVRAPGDELGIGRARGERGGGARIGGAGISEGFHSAASRVTAAASSAAWTSAIAATMLG